MHIGGDSLPPGAGRLGADPDLRLAAGQRAEERVGRGGGNAKVRSQR